MKKTLVSFLETIFGICLMYSVIVGAVVCLMYLVGFIAGGTLGTIMAVKGAKIMNNAFPIAATGTLLGLFAFYIEDKHELTMENDKK